jgi:hypothetical protein
MLSDERLAEIESKRSLMGVMSRLVTRELIDEIRRLRSEIDILRARDNDAEAIIADQQKKIARFTEGMPSVDAIRTASVLIHGTVVSEYNGYSEKGRQKLYDVNNWLRRLAAGGERE